MIILRVLSLCTVASLLAAQTSLDLANKAEQQIRTGQKQAALTTLKFAAQAKDQSAQSEDRIGFLFAVLGDTSDAHDHFAKAIAVNSDYAPAHFHLGAADWLAGEKQEGLRELSTAAQLDPGNYEYRYRLGAADLDIGDSDSAIAQLQQAVRLNGATEAAYRSLGQALKAKGDLVAAITAYEQGLRLKDDENARDELSTLLIQTRQPDGGIAEANRVLAQDPHNFAAHMNLGYAYLKTGEYVKAEAAYRLAVEDDLKAAAPHYDLGIALKMQDHLDEARREFQRSIELDPTLAEAQYSIGIIAWQSGDFAAMITAMRAATAIRPEYPEAHYMLGIALKSSDKPDDAIAELREAIRLDPTTPGPYNTLGQLLRIKGDKQASAEAFATGARVKKEKDARLTNTLDQGMRGGEMPTPKQ